MPLSLVLFSHSCMHQFKSDCTEILITFRHSTHPSNTNQITAATLKFRLSLFFFLFFFNNFRGKLCLLVFFSEMTLQLWTLNYRLVWKNKEESGCWLMHLNAQHWLKKLSQVRSGMWSCRYAAAKVLQHCIRSFGHDGCSGCAERISLHTETPEGQHMLQFLCVCDFHPDFTIIDFLIPIFSSFRKHKKTHR